MRWRSEVRRESGRPWEQAREDLDTVDKLTGVQKDYASAFFLRTSSREGAQGSVFGREAASASRP